MAVYTDLSFSQAKAFLSNFPIGELLKCEGIAQGVENSNFRIETSRGLYILTIYEKRVRREDLPWFLGFMHHLSEHGLPVPNPVEDKQGRVIHNLLGKPAALTTFLPGKSLHQIDSSHCFHVGKALADLHLKARSFHPKRPNSMGCQSWRKLLKECQKGLQLAREDFPYEELEQIAETVCDKWPRHDRNASLPQGQIHADLFPDNVLFKGNNVSGLIDFYFACTDFLAYDIAICINSWCFSPNNAYQKDNVQSLIDGYQNSRQLRDEEKQCLPLFLQGAALRFLLTRLYDRVNTPSDAFVERKDPMEYFTKLRFFQNIEARDVFY